MTTAKIITYFGQKAKVDCDRNCNKAWGINSRPKVQLSDDEDDYAFLADGELGDAPIDPGTYEGCDAKPKTPAEFPNRWCVRECERHVMSKPGEADLPLKLPDFTRRVFNMDAREAEYLNDADREDVANVMQIADNLDTMSRWLRMDYYRRNYMVRREKWGKR